ncbi:hypothetical protein IKX73_03075 [Candidatus Saccharibacteria bacterium]|nr:hypothetical protein [Candidatus Saccharibacteria bacterium]
MIKIFYGDDRVRAKQEIIKNLGNDYEVLDGNDIEKNNLPTIFLGASLFVDKRKILIHDFTANKQIFSELEKYLDTPHDIILFETKLDKRSTTYKALKDKLEFREFKLPENTDFRIVFDIYRTAKKDGKKAIKMLEKIKLNEDPIQFTGLLVSQAIKDYAAHQGITEKRILRELARTDLQMKTTKVEPWLLVESFLLRLA